MWDPYFNGRGSLLIPATKDITTSTTVHTTAVDVSSTILSTTGSTSLSVFSVSKSTSISSLSPIVEETVLELATIVSPSDLSVAPDTATRATSPLSIKTEEEPISMTTVPDLTMLPSNGPSSYVSLTDFGPISVANESTYGSTPDNVSLLSVTDELASTIAPLTGILDPDPNDQQSILSTMENLATVAQESMPVLPSIPERILPQAEVLDRPLIPAVPRDVGSDSRVHLASAVAAGAVATVLLSVAVLFIMKAYWTRRHGEEVAARGVYSTVSVTESINRVLSATFVKTTFIYVFLFLLVCRVIFSRIYSF